MKTTQEMIEVMSAYAREEQIEFRSKSAKDYILCNHEPNWDWHHYDYRIKPKAKVKRWLWAYPVNSCTAVWKQTDVFYTDAEAHDRYRICIKIESSMIEVDE